MTPRERILDTIKEEMIENISNITLENLNEVDTLNNELFGYAYYLVEVHNYTEPTELVHHSDLETKTNEVEINTIESDKDSGIFERKLAHGFIQNNHGDNIFVPESIIRENDFSHGDVIAYECIHESSNGKRLYNYELIQKSKEDHPDRMVFKEGIVRTQIDNKIVVTYNDKNENISNIQNGILSYEVTQQDIDQFDINPYDKVDIAWYRNDPDKTMRIIWKY